MRCVEPSFYEIFSRHRQPDIFLRLNELASCDYDPFGIHACELGSEACNRSACNAICGQPDAWDDFTRECLAIRIKRRLNPIELTFNPDQSVGAG